MIKLEVHPTQVYGFYENYASVSRLLVEHVQLKGWKYIPPVPVFEIPKISGKKQDYMLIDGNHRKNVAQFLDHLLPIALYEPDEEINYLRDGLAYSRTLVYPKRYEKALSIYLLKVCPRLLCSHTDGLEGI